MVVAVIENDSVKNRIDDVPESARKNECNCNNQIIRAVFFDRIPKPIANRCNGDKPEKCEKQFAIRARNFGSPSHTFIFNKQDFEPAEHVDFFSEYKIG